MSGTAFQALGLSPLYTRALQERGIETPTKIQEKVIPRLREGESFLFRSATGTGKTFAYLLPLLEKLSLLLQEDPGPLRGKPLFLIVAPTFELCSQIKAELDFLLKGRSQGSPESEPIPLRSILLIGSAALGRQGDLLKKERPEVIVGSPGRLLALARQRKLQLRELRFVVLDEGDKLVQDELYGETQELLSLIKGPFQGTSCSATIPPRGRQRLAQLLALSDEASSSIDDTSENVLKNQVEHWAFHSSERDKPSLLRSLISALEGQKPRSKGRLNTPVKALIFTRRGEDVERICSRLLYHKVPVDGLWGGMDSQGRKQALDNFKSGRARFLVTSDLAGRGLDVPDISHVIALDLGDDRDIYVHRSGRTARAGKRGIMVTIGTEGELRRLAALEKTLGITVYPKILYGGKILAP
ncbi:MAG: DEAD/DEAH box helicase [Treponema sp.]|nr:DEAD/DEAH box helicase [Treponema sp.]